MCQRSNCDGNVSILLEQNKNGNTIYQNRMLQEKFAVLKGQSKKKN